MIKPLFEKYYYKVITKGNKQSLVLYERYNVHDFIENADEILSQFIDHNRVHMSGRKGANTLQNSLVYKQYATGKKARSCLCLGASFDIETTKINDHLTFMYGWQFGLSNIVIWGETWEEVILLFDFLKAQFQFRKSHRLLVFVANLGYEWQFAKHYLNVTQAFLKEKREPIEIEHDEFIILKECLSWGGSLEKLAQDYTDLIKLKGDLDYSIYRESYYNFTEEHEWQYIDFDVLTLTHFGEWYYKTFSKTPQSMTKPITIQSSIRNTFYDKAKDTQDLDKMKRSLIKDSRQYKILVNNVYRGGFVHSNKLYVNTPVIYEDLGVKLWSYDFTSSYPSVMCVSKMPWKFNNCINKRMYDVENILKSDLEEYAYIGKFKFRNIRAKTSHSIESSSKTIPVIKDKDPRGIIDNGRINKFEGDLIVWLTEQDLLSYNDFYAWDKCEVMELWQSKKEYLPKYIIDVLIEKYFYKDYNKKHDLPYAQEKAILNSLYGVCCAKMPLGEIYIKDGNAYSTIDREEEETDEEYKNRIDQLYVDTYNKDIESEKKTLLAQWGVYISSIARRNLLETVFKLEETNNPVLYCDTDSIKFLDYNNGIKIIEEYNKKQTEKIKAFCKRTGSDFNIFYDLGSFDCEYKDGIKAFKTLGCKRYLHVYDEKGETHYQCTVAGLPKSDYIDAYKPQNDANYREFLTPFKDGLEMDETSKLTSCYVDELQSFTMRDGSIRFVPSCITLNDCTFHLGMNEIWLTYLKQIADSKFEQRN